MANFAAQRQIVRGNKHNPDLTKEVKAGYHGHVRNLGVPEKIKCITCKTVKSLPSFSKNKLALLADHMKGKSSFNAALQVHIPCSTCSGGQVTELTCHFCDKTKGLDAFPKTARRTPDKAMCWKCSQEKAEYEPGAREDDDSDSNGSRPEYSDYSDDENFNVTGGTGVDWDSKTSVATYPGGPPSTNASVSGGGVPLLASGTATSTAPSDGGMSVRDSSGNGKFAKLRAVPQPKKKKNQQREPESDSQDVPSSDDSDEPTIYSL